MIKIYLVTVAAAGGLLLVGCTRNVENASQKFNELPPAVQKTVRAQAPNAEIADVSHKTKDGVEVYEVEFRDAGKNPKIVVAADGRLLTTDLAKPAGAIDRLLTPTGATGTKLSALPETAQKAIKSKLSGQAQISGITRHEDNGRVIYEVEFIDQGKRSTLQVAQDGTLVQDVQTKEAQPVVPPNP